MSGDFEKNISHQLESFQLNPSPQVWERVVAALPEKRRRRFAIWWLLPLAACLCGGVWLMVDKLKNADNKQTAGLARRSAVVDTSIKKLINLPVDTTRDETLQRDGEQKTVVNEKRFNVRHKPHQVKKEVATGYPVNVSKSSLQTGVINGVRRKKIHTPENSFLKRHSETPVIQTEGIRYVLNHSAGTAAIQNEKNNDVILLSNVPLLPLIDSVIILLPRVVTKNDTALANRSDTLSGNAVETTASKAKNKNRKAEWSLIIGFGKSSLANSSSDMRKSLDAVNLSNSVGQTSIPGGIFRNPTGSFSVSAGIMRRQMISKHISWQTEVSYQFLTAKQRVGNRNDSLPQANALANIAFYRTNSILNDQGTTIQSDRVHRLQVAPGLLYTLNPQVRLPFRFFAGLAVAYTISNHLLLHDYSSGSYIRSAKLSNKVMFGGEAGMDICINHHIQAGLFYQHDFTNVAKVKAGSVFHWNQLQLRIGIPLSKYR